MDIKQLLPDLSHIHSEEELMSSDTYVDAYVALTHLFNYLWKNQKFEEAVTVIRHMPQYIKKHMLERINNILNQVLAKRENTR